MAKTKSSGTTKLGRDSKPKYLGVKLYGGQLVKPGSIIVRQRGTKFIPGANVKEGNDNTLYAVAKGKVQFKYRKKKGFDGLTKKVKVVSVI